MKIKKLTLMILSLIVLTVGVIGCSKQTDTNKENATDENRDFYISEELEENKKVTLEKVKNTPMTDAAEFNYEKMEDGIHITEYLGSDEIVSIPTMIDGKTVIAIGNNAFINNDSMKGIKIADTVKVIGEGAFMNCTELLIVVFGNEVESIEQYAFSGSKKLHLVELNNGLKNMGWGSFGLTNLTEIEIPSSVIVIDYPFNVNNEEHYITIVGEAGSMAEQFVNESEDEDHLKFRAK